MDKGPVNHIRVRCRGATNFFYVREGGKS
jgi:hypothetical protein